MKLIVYLHTIITMNTVKNYIFILDNTILAEDMILLNHYYDSYSYKI